MVKFEFLKDNTSEYETTRVKVNSCYDKKSFVISGLDISNKRIYIYSQDVINIIYNEKINNLLYEDIEFIQIPLDKLYTPVTIEERDNSEIFIKKDKDEYIIGCSFQYDSEYWKRGYSIAEKVSNLSKVTSKREKISFKIEDSETILNGFVFYKEIEFIDGILRDEISKFMIEIIEIFQESHQYLEKKNKNSIFFEFNVNDSIKVACKQYLIYFTQFLADMGIGSKAEIKDDVNKILFKVVPNDKTIALKRIKEALEIYISLIDCEEIQFYNYHNNAAVMQLQSNIHHLKSQLMLANTIIEQQRISIDLLNNTKVSIDVEEKEEISLLGGAIKLKEFECKGMTINPARIFKLLKRK